jgi:cob(I)alamin adenosyltransferase
MTLPTPDAATLAALGQTQVYTGDGKGKTTCAMGLVLRAAGRGLKCYVGQFVKGRPTGEMTALADRFADRVVFEQYGWEEFPCLGKPPTEKDYRLALAGLDKLDAALRGGEYHLVVADEINIAVACGLIGWWEAVRLIDRRPAGVELVLTGRAAHPAVVAAAGLVTEMRPVKHYFDAGVMARKGIEE